MHKDLRARGQRLFQTDPSSILKVFLLKKCPYSKSLARLLKNEDRVQKKWVGRDSTLFFHYKQLYDSSTYPIVVVAAGNQEIHIGGFSEFYEWKKK